MVRLVGGDLSVDLLNTVDPEVPGGDHIGTAAGLAAWFDQVGLDGGAAVGEAYAVRAVLAAVLRPIANGREPEPVALDALRRLESDAIARAELHRGGWRFSAPLDAIVHAAVELLHHGPVDRLKRCGNCPWLYIDLSRNGSRRWCSMEACGTEVKIRRLTERRRSAR